MDPSTYIARFEKTFQVVITWFLFLNHPTAHHWPSQQMGLSKYHSLAPLQPRNESFTESSNNLDDKMSWKTCLCEKTHRSHMRQKKQKRLSCAYVFWLVVEPTHLKNISRNGSFPQVGVNINNVWNHHQVFCWRSLSRNTSLRKNIPLYWVWKESVRSRIDTTPWRISKIWPIFNPW